MTSLSEEELCQCLSSILLDDNENDDIDENIIEYLAGMLSDSDSFPIPDIANSQELVADGDNSEHIVYEAIAPFLESSGCDIDLILKSCNAVVKLALKYDDASSRTHKVKSGASSTSSSSVVKLKQGVVSMSSHLQPQDEAEEDANRFLWGTDTVGNYTNKSQDAHTEKLSAKDKRKQRQELEKARKEYEAKMRALEAEEAKEGDGAVFAKMVLPDYNSGRNEKDIQVKNVGISLDNGRTLLSGADLKFSHLHRYGLVGKNGIGKTTLLKAIASMEIEGFPRHHRVLHVRQEVKSAGTDISVLQAVLNADVERNTLLQEEKDIMAKLDSEEEEKHDESDLLKKLDQIHERLGNLNSSTAEARAAQILSGLQFSTEMQRGPTSALSGGWRMRVSLAAALYIEPDLLLLDEPTNHLDLEAVLWLESYLVDYKHTVIIVSHDRGFLNEICTDIIDFKNLTLTYYKGNYDTYVKTEAEMVKNQMRVYQAYLDKRAHMMEFITKFRANAKRASIVQSRIKAVEKMDAEAPSAVEIDSIWRFSIPNPEPLGRPIISIDDASFDYAPENKKKSDYLLQEVNFGIDLDSRIGILGANGAGKSTLLNMITDKLTPLRGSISRNGRLRIGIFTQHSGDKFDLQLSAVENMLNLFPTANVSDQDMRSFIGKFQLQGEEVLKPMMMLSGGQKSRLAFAALAYQRPHVIIMDEPTNHLDMESIDALVEAVKDFKGGLVVVSHDQYFITNTCGELWVVADGRTTRFRGDFETYKKHTLEKTAKRVAQSVKSLSNINN